MNLPSVLIEPRKCPKEPKRSERYESIFYQLHPGSQDLSVARKMYPQNDTCYICTRSELSQSLPSMLNVYPVYKKYWQGV